MSVLQVLTLGNVGQTFKPAHIEAGKFDVNIDKDTLLAALDGTLSVNTQVGPGESAALKALIQAQETNTSMTYDALTKTITFTNEDGQESTIDLSSLAVDVFVDGASYDAATMVLTLTDNSGTTPNVTVNLADLKKVETVNSSTITLSGTGETAGKLKAEIKISPDNGNAMQARANGLFVGEITTTHINAANGINVASMSDSTAPGYNDVYHNISVKADASADNLLSVGADGVMVSKEAVKALATVEVKDAFGVHLYYAMP